MDVVQKTIDVSQQLMERLNVVTFSCEGKTVRVAKELLLNASPNFKGLLSGSFKESKDGVIELEHISYYVFNALVQFILNGKLETDHWTNCDWKSALILAHQYQFEQFLQKLVQDVPLIQLQWKDIVEMLNLAERLAIQELVEKCWTEVDSLGDHVVADLTAFAQLPEAIVSKLVTRDSFYVDVHQLLAAVIGWLDVHPSAEPKSLLAHIHWELINPELLGEAASLKALFASAENERPRPLKLSCTQACHPNVNIASLFLDKSSKLLETGNNKVDHHYVEAFHHKAYTTLVEFPIAFRLNTVRFKLFERTTYSLRVFGQNPCNEREETNWTGESWQEIYLEDQFVKTISICPNGCIFLNSLECSFRTDIPQLCENNSFIARENMVAAPDFPFKSNSCQRNEIHFALRQPCHASSVAVYLRHYKKEWPVGISDERGLQIPIVKQDQVQFGTTTVLVLRFGRRCLSEVRVSGCDVIVNLRRIECPADTTKLGLNGEN